MFDISMWHRFFQAIDLVQHPPSPGHLQSPHPATLPSRLQSPSVALSTKGPMAMGQGSFEVPGTFIYL